MKEERVSNYIKLCDEWAEKFLRMDKMELMKKLPELKQEDGYLKIVHFVVFASKMPIHKAPKEVFTTSLLCGRIQENQLHGGSHGQFLY